MVTTSARAAKHLSALHTLHRHIIQFSNIRLLQAGEFSQEGLFCYPPAFRAATQQLLLISHKYGGVRQQDGQLRWPFRTEELVGLLLPVMGRGSMTAWVTP